MIWKAQFQHAIWPVALWATMRTFLGKRPLRPTAVCRSVLNVGECRTAQLSKVPLSIGTHLPWVCYMTTRHSMEHDIVGQASPPNIDDVAIRIARQPSEVPAIVTIEMNQTRDPDMRPGTYCGFTSAEK